MWAQQPLIQPMGRRPYPSGRRHLPHVNFVCRVSPSISALHPNAVDRALAGRALSGHPGGSYSLDLVRPTSKADIRLISLLSFSLPPFSHSSAQLPLFLLFLPKAAIRFRMPRRWLSSLALLSRNKASASTAQGCRLGSKRGKADERNE